MKYLKYIICIIIALNCNVVDASIIASIDDKLYSKVLDENRELLVRLPKGYKENRDRRYPVLYLLDGPEQISQTSGPLDSLSRFELIPELIVVGIKNTHRDRDFTPTVDKEWHTKTGGADNFLDFLETELKPYVNKKYRTVDYNILAGHSLGGLLALHALQTRPSLFQAHFAFSPSIWWNESKVVKDMKVFLASNTKLKNYLYVNMGSELGDMRKGFSELRASFENNAPEYFRFKADLFEHEDHVTTPIIGQYHAYRDLYSNWRIRIAKFSDEADPIALITEHYRKLTQRYGYKLLPPEKIFNEAGYYYLYSRKDAKTAIKIFLHNVKVNPNSGNAYDSLVEALGVDGQVEEALKQVEIGLELTNENSNIHAALLKRKTKMAKGIPQLEE